MPLWIAQEEKIEVGTQVKYRDLPLMRVSEAVLRLSVSTLVRWNYDIDEVPLSSMSETKIWFMKLEGQHQ